MRKKLTGRTRVHAGGVPDGTQQECFRAEVSQEFRAFIREGWGVARSIIAPDRCRSVQALAQHHQHSTEKRERHVATPTTCCVKASGLLLKKQFIEDYFLRWRVPASCNANPANLSDVISLFSYCSCANVSISPGCPCCRIDMMNGCRFIH